jgi:arsenate reductase (glutaredoxin)
MGRMVPRAFTFGRRSGDGRRPWIRRYASGVAKPEQPVIQVFGTASDQSTRAAIRFFRERRTAISFVDMRKRPIAPGELRRFVERLGPRALLDETSRAYRDAGLGYLRMDDEDIVRRLQADARLLRLPLVRRGNDVTVGRAESTWMVWLKPAADA